MKRASYSIPLLSFGVTLIGCQDPIVSYAEVDSATGVPCVIEASASMTVDQELQAILTVNYALTCDDATLNESLVYNYTAVIEAVEPGSLYKIALDEQGTQVALDCAMDSKNALLCNNEGGDAFAFEPK
jgi:hypothetical protein